eukprot:TRINITY_DN1536_c0_g1_i2.p1 TRINITY_DN1536_c0_g1~~TRINITY_DN1536_c0_g1_i2.p1  ORF type:complete len:119 (+),score=9.31 TRINITY_DN1536_c0_g1_i2:49-405(+)
MVNTQQAFRYNQMETYSDLLELEETIYNLQDLFCISVCNYGGDNQGNYFIQLLNEDTKELMQLSKIIPAFNQLILNETKMSTLVIPGPHRTIYCSVIMNKSVLNMLNTFVEALCELAN